MGASNSDDDSGTGAVKLVRVLVVEDENDDFTLLAATVREVDHHRYDLEWVGCWDDGERRLNGNAFDIVICDFHLKEMTAIDVMDRMDELGIEIPVIVLTSDASLETDLQSMQQGAYDYLEKSHLTAESFDRCIRYTLTRHQLEQQVRRAAFYDELTGLPNRRFLIERMGQALARAQRKESEVSIVLIDLNNFKPNNDNYGHEAGDHVLATTGRRITDSVRRTDTAARWGGDEFVVILEDFKERGNASMVIEKTMAAIEELIDVDGGVVKVSGSFGVVFFPEFCLDVDQMIKLADHAMYRAKEVHRASGAEGSTMIVMSVQEVGDNAE
jgi:diguanylate cyclase (GGDEF)-like protein